jgi:hypothetical protein
MSKERFDFLGNENVSTTDGIGSAGGIPECAEGNPPKRGNLGFLGDNAG